MKTSGSPDTMRMVVANQYQEIRDSLRQLYLEDPRPWLLGFSGGKDSTLVAALVFDAILSISSEQRTKPVTVLCTDTRVEIPAIAEGIESALDRMRRCSKAAGLSIEAQLLKPPPEQSFWVNIIGRGYPPPNRVFRWRTQRLKIDPVTNFVQKHLQDGHWSEAILLLGARRAESSTRAQTMAGREKRNGLNRHPDLPRVWVSNPIEFLITEEVYSRNRIVTYHRRRQHSESNARTSVLAMRAPRRKTHLLGSTEIRARQLEKTL